VEYVFVDGQEFHPSKELQQGPPAGGGRRPGATPSEELQ